MDKYVSAPFHCRIEYDPVSKIETAADKVLNFINTVSYKISLWNWQKLFFFYIYGII